MTFDDMTLDPRIHHVLRENDFTKPTPVQEQAIPVILEGRDVIAIAQTGTGKTLSYVLPGFTRLAEGKIERNMMLVLTPTRELANQVHSVTEDFGKPMKIRSTAIYGGVDYKPQNEALRQGSPVIIATPGRLLDHMGRGNIDFGNLMIFVLDEADRMLDMGFMPDIQRIVRKIPKKRQTIMCSATWPPEIARLSDQLMKDPEEIKVGQVHQPVEKVRQVLYPVFAEDKTRLLLHILEDEKDLDATIVFLRTKERTDRVYKTLKNKGYNTAVLHGDRSQSQRQEALDGFRKGKYNMLVATDVAARGLDIENISHVINYDIPENSDDYLHRIGRTARADAEGAAFTFVTPQESEHLANIERALGKNLPRGEWERTAPVLSTYRPAGAKRKRGGSRRRKGNLLRRR